jgi:hypothetical protein
MFHLSLSGRIFIRTGTIRFILSVKRAKKTEGFPFDSMDEQTIYEASLKPESRRFKHCSEKKLACLYERKKRIVETLGGQVAEEDGPLLCFPLWVRVAFLDEFIRLRGSPAAGDDPEKSDKQ